MIHNHKDHCPGSVLSHHVVVYGELKKIKILKYHYDVTPVTEFCLDKYTHSKYKGVCPLLMKNSSQMLFVSHQLSSSKTAERLDFYVS